MCEEDEIDGMLAAGTDVGPGAGGVGVPPGGEGGDGVPPVPVTVIENDRLA